MAKFLDNWKNKVTTYKNKAEEIRAMIRRRRFAHSCGCRGHRRDLKADSKEKMMESLEKPDAERVFKEAGYLLSAIELEMGFNPKVVAVLKRESEVDPAKNAFLNSTRITKCSPPCSPPCSRPRRWRIRFTFAA